MTLLALALSTPALAGYGDVGVDVPSENGGVERNTEYPSLAERELHMYTNMVRVEPEAFEDWYNAYGCSFDGFEPGEQTPQAPVYFSRPLNEAARFHSQDMRDNSWFDHDSSDGTSFGTRVARWYSESGFVGENIAQGYTIEQAVFGGWMCSSGHRAKIMNGGYNEFGAGVVGNYYTQDFASGTVDTRDPIAMGVHVPPIPTVGETVTFYADYGGTGADRMEVVLTGQAHEMDLILGTESQGVWAVDLEMPDGIHHGDRCEQYYFQSSDAAGQARFPETGSYQIGRDCDNPNHGWVPWQFGVTGRDDLSEAELSHDVSITGSGCSTAPGAPTGWAALGLALVLGWRRRDSGGAHSHS